MVPQLILVKRIFLEATRHEETQNDPVDAGLAISLLQDAVELYLWTVIKERDITVKKDAGFILYLDSLKGAGLEMPFSAKLRELNTARVGFKHYGNLPAPSEASKHKAYVEDSLRQAFSDHFGQNFDDISLIDLIADESIRQHLKTAEAHIINGEFMETAQELAKAKTLTFRQMGKFLPSVDSNLATTDQFLREIDGGRGSNPFSYIASYLSTLREATLVGMFHLPRRDYTLLQNTLPSALQTMSGKWQIYVQRSSYTETECRQALDSIINICLRLQTNT